MRKPNHRFVIERLLPRPPVGAAHNIRRVWQKVGFAGRLAAAETIAKNIMTDTADFVRIRQVRA
jgi:hypothetical protein